MKEKNIGLLIIFFLVAHCYAVDNLELTQYKGLCAEFWDLDKPKPPAQEYAFFRDYVAQSSGPILEPMCGTGRYLIPLLEEGFNVEGFDASSHMLNALRNKCAQKKLSPRVWEQFLEVAPATKQYNLIFIPDTSFCIFQDRVHIKKCLQRIYALLQSGGIFVLDLHTNHSRAEHIGLWSGKAYKRADGNILIESVLALPVENSVAPLILRYELMSKTEILKTEVEYYPIKLYQPGEMDGLLREVGFTQIKKIKAHDRMGILSFRDDTVVYECSK